MRIGIIVAVPGPEMSHGSCETHEASDASDSIHEATECYCPVTGTYAPRFTPIEAAPASAAG